MSRRLEWFLLIVLAAVGVFSWCRLGLPRYQVIDLSVSQTKAVDIAGKFLKNQYKVDSQGYKIAVIFNVDEDTDRYLQKTLGIAASQQLIRRLHYDLFYWDVRFFKERQKEEFRVFVSSATGQVIGAHHLIEDTAFRPPVDKEQARQFAFGFLKNSFGFDPSQYVPYDESVKKYDNRVNYYFSWRNKDVDLPWKKGKEKGSAKLLANVTVSGHEVLYFDKYQFDIPEGFDRYVDSLKQTGQNLTLVFSLLYLALLGIAIMVVINHKGQVVSRIVKPFYIQAGAVMFVLMFLDMVNSYQSLLFDYPTTQSFGDYVFRQFIENIIGPFFVALTFVLPAMGGESLRFTASARHKNGGFLSTLLSSFCSATIARQIFVGYIAAAIILGLQAFIFHLGFKYCGVWDELSWLTKASTTLVPAFTALVIGFQASFSEETMFRLFAINLFKKYGLPVGLGVLLSAMIWGFGHTGYEIFPMWFRGLEVTCIGIVMGIFYLRFGLVCVIAAHFLIDSFLSNLPYLLKPHASFDFFSALGVISLPLLLGLIALIFNRNTRERPLSIRFNAQQQFNYNLLQGLCRSKTPAELSAFKDELKRHGWDEAIIQRLDIQGDKN